MPPPRSNGGRGGGSGRCGVVLVVRGGAGYFWMPSRWIAAAVKVISAEAFS